MDYRACIEDLAFKGNLRTLPREAAPASVIDFSSNDYLGIGADAEMQAEFLDRWRGGGLTSSASRLLAGAPEEYNRLETTLEKLYCRPALVFNSGYHANTGLVPALCGRDTLILADKLVHASVIDGIMLARCRWSRWRHNDTDDLERQLAREAPQTPVLIIAESIYSMDGDTAPLEALAEIKRRRPGTMLYMDEAHAFGCLGPGGLGLNMASTRPDDADVVVGTLGKAAASIGAFAVFNDTVLKQIAVNRCRSLIFSTALPPLNIAWSRHVVERLPEMDDRRSRLKTLSLRLKEILGGENEATHIRPLMVGDASKAVALSHQLFQRGVKALPIRVPTVPPGTERLRLSLSAAMTQSQLDTLASALEAAHT